MLTKSFLFEFCLLSCAHRPVIWIIKVSHHHVSLNIDWDVVRITTSGDTNGTHSPVLVKMLIENVIDHQVMTCKLLFVAECTGKSFLSSIFWRNSWDLLLLHTHGKRIVIEVANWLMLSKTKRILLLINSAKYWWTIHWLSKLVVMCLMHRIRRLLLDLWCWFLNWLDLRISEFFLYFILLYLFFLLNWLIN